MPTLTTPKYRKEPPPHDSLLWQRCKSGCGCDRNPSRYTACACKGGCERSGPDRKQRNTYSLMVTEALTGYRGASDFKCPLCATIRPLREASVDRVNGPLYAPGNVVTVCTTCNAERGYLQTHARDLPGIARYIADVLKASATVTVLAKNQTYVMPTGGMARHRDLKHGHSLSLGPYMTK